MSDHSVEILAPGIPVCDVPPEIVRFLGMTVHPHSLEELNTLVARGIIENRRWVIANHNLHSLFLMRRSARVREFYDHADWTAIDGMPIVALARLYGYRLSRDQRVTYADWMMPLMELCAANGWRVFYLGSRPGVAEKGVDHLRRQFKNLQIIEHHGYFDAKSSSAENSAVLGQINDYNPDICLVGMGMPRQELWIQENRDQINARILLPAGAAMDYIAGEVPTPPRWSGRLGLEWAFRLVHEPKRLFGRYMVEPWYIFGLLCVDHAKRAFQFRQERA
jgi:N-acetylglucosaminyldiphosphoundecaprenol N-acetyl-beta-D-mannosaminyltransferase